MNPKDLIRFHPNLYHVTDVENWESIRKHGLLSTSKLLDLFEVSGGRRFKLERQCRPNSVPLEHPVHGKAILRDNKPLAESRLESCLRDGLTPQDWYAILNCRVFFWPTWERVERLLGAAAYRWSHQLAIKVPTKRLLEACGDRIELSPMNSGATRPMAHPRGLGTFTALDDYKFEEWRRKRGPTKAVVEVTVLDAVGDIAELATSAICHCPSGDERVVWRSRS